MARQKTRHSRRGIGLLGMQSLLCAAALLIALLLRMIGGAAYEQLRASFQRAISDDSLADAMSDALEAEGQGGQDIPLGTARISAVSEGSTAASLGITAEPHPLLRGGTKTSEFGYRTDPIRGGVGFHTGVDIAAPSGTPLYAVLSGTVIRADWDNSYGRYVILQCDNGVELWYAHCSVLLVEEGEGVRAGDTIARVGSTGNSTGPHVHFMVRQNGVTYDPNCLIAENCYA